MSGRSPQALTSVRAFVPLAGLCLWAACSSEPTDFFGAPNASAGKGAAAGSSGPGVGGTGTDHAGKGGTSAGSGTDVGGSGATSGAAPVGGSSNPGGGSTHVGGAGGDLPAHGGSAQGGTQPDGGVSGENGAGENGTGGTTTAGEAGAPGGSAGESGNGTGGTGGGTGGSAGATGGSAGATGGSAGATGGSAGSTAGTGGQPDTCHGDGDCSSNEYCKTTACNDPTGVCAQRATACTGADATLNPVCGCDHMTYYTACVAAHEGVNVATSGECQSGAATCTRTGGSGASCVPKRDRAACYRTRSVCTSAAGPDAGVCWVLPETCPDEDPAQLDCNNPGESLCRGLCDALENKRPIVRNSSQCTMP